MKQFRLKKHKTLKNTYIFKFANYYFEKLKIAHPLAMNLIIYSIIGYNKKYANKTFLLDYDQSILLEQRLQEHNKIKKDKTYTQYILEASFIKGFSIMDIKLDDAPELLSEIYEIILSKTNYILRS